MGPFRCGRLGLLAAPPAGPRPPSARRRRRPPPEIAPKIPEAVASIEATERRIISLCQSPDFSVERLKALYKEIRPGTY